MAKVTKWSSFPGHRLINSVGLSIRRSDGWYCVECDSFRSEDAKENPIICNKFHQVLDEEVALERAKELDHLGDIDSLTKFDELCDDPYYIDYAYKKEKTVQCRSVRFVWRDFSKKDEKPVDKYDQNFLKFWTEFKKK